METDPKPQHKVPWVAIVLGLLALITFWNISGQSGGGVTYDVQPDEVGAVPPMVTEFAMPARDMALPQNSPGAASAMPEMDASYDSKYMGMPAPPYYYGGTASAKDTREFNKIYYGASMMARDVQKLTRRVETTVRGHGGRIDSMSSAEKYGSLSFVISESKFQAFRNELESLVDSRFLTVNINTQNLLPQKQAIEEQRDYTDMNLTEVASARKKATSDYSAKKAEIQYQVDANDREYEMLQVALASADQNTRPNISARQSTLLSEQASLRSQLRTLESTYLATINSLDAQKRYLEQNADALGKQDEVLMEDVATVNGSVSIQWVSFWQVAQLYLPGYSIPWILVFLALVAFMWQRHREAKLVD